MRIAHTGATPGETKLANWLVTWMTKQAKSDFCKDSLIYKVTIKAICKQISIIKEYGRCNHENVVAVMEELIYE